MAISESKTTDYARGFSEAVATMQPAQILTVDVANELLERCERSSESRPNNTVSDFLVPPEILHELLVVWKASR